MYSIYEYVIHVGIHNECIMCNLHFHPVRQPSDVVVRLDDAGGALEVCTCLYIYIYIYTHMYRERYTYVYIYIYICRDRERER